jgi:hypothetical protein
MPFTKVGVRPTGLKYPIRTPSSRKWLPKPKHKIVFPEYGTVDPMYRPGIENPIKKNDEIILPRRERYYRVFKKLSKGKK